MCSTGVRRFFHLYPCICTRLRQLSGALRASVRSLCECVFVCTRAHASKQNFRMFELCALMRRPWWDVQRGDTDRAQSTFVFGGNCRVMHVAGRCFFRVFCCGLLIGRLCVSVCVGGWQLNQTADTILHRSRKNPRTERISPVARARDVRTNRYRQSVDWILRRASYRADGRLDCNCRYLRRSL